MHEEEIKRLSRELTMLKRTLHTKKPAALPPPPATTLIKAAGQPQLQAAGQQPLYFYKV